MTDRYGTALADTVRCRSCGHMQLERLPEDDALARAYGTAESPDALSEEAGQRETARRTLRAIERHTPPGNLLDLGCWVGFLPAEAGARGWDATGVEPSEHASRLGRERLGLDVRTGGLLDTPLPERHFDAVVMADVLEHLPAPGEAVRRVGRLLRPGGVLALLLPDAGSRLARALGARWWSVLPTHVHYFTRRSLVLLLERNGFRPLEVTTAPKTFTVGYYVGRLGGYSRPLAAALIRAAEATRTVDRMWAPDLRDRMMVLATTREEPGARGSGGRQRRG